MKGKNITVIKALMNAQSYVIKDTDDMKRFKIIIKKIMWCSCYLIRSTGQ